MKAEPCEDAVILEVESRLELAAMLRWAGRRAEARHEEDFMGRPYIVLSFREAEASVNVDTPGRRVVRLPAIGQRVGLAGGKREGMVTSLAIHRDRMKVWVVPDGDCVSGDWPPDEVTPVGDDPRWVEVVLPGEE